MIKTGYPTIRAFDGVLHETQQVRVTMEIIVSVILLFVGIAVLVTIHIYMVGRAFRKGFRSRDAGGNDSQGIILHRARSGTARGLSIEDLKMIPWFDYKQVQEGESSAVDCAVCLEGFKVGDTCRLLPSCHHCFHLQCVDHWLINKPFCPICRASVMPTKKSVVGDQSCGSGLGADKLADLCRTKEGICMCHTCDLRC